MSETRANLAQDAQTSRPATPIISVQGVVVRYGEHTILDGVNLDILPHEVMVIMGASGSGKSTLLRQMVGLEKPKAGRIIIKGVDITSCPESELNEIRRVMGVSFQSAALFNSMTLGDNVALPLREHTKLAEPTIKLMTQMKLAQVGLEESEHLYPAQLSGGMRKRAGLARALALDPEILFLDEPTAGLDPIGAAAFDHLIRTLQQALGLTVFLITHDLDTLYAICDRVAVLADRKVIGCAPLAEVEKIDHPWLQEYFHGPRARAAQVARDKNEGG
jgi:phospholipid/cholesterol/gamma-HCH transport system ATP-binding protein